MPADWIIVSLLFTGVIGYHAAFWFRAKACFRRYAQLNGGQLGKAKGRLVLALEKPEGSEFRYYSTKRAFVTTYYQRLPESLKDFEIILRVRNPVKIHTVNFSGLERVHNSGSAAFQRKYQVYCNDKDRAERLVTTLLEEAFMHPPRGLGGDFDLQLYAGEFRFLWKKCPSSNQELDELLKLGQKVLSQLVNIAH